MNRTDRLVAMVMFLQGRRLVRAEDLAAHFEVSLRTVYRDVSALSESGVPVAGEAGVGYTLVKGYHLPPVSFTAEEATALFVGGEMVKRYTDASMKGPAESALLKIRSVLPRERQDELDRLAQVTEFGGDHRPPPGLKKRALLPIKQALVERRVLNLIYRAKDREENTARDVEPLGLVFYGDTWYLIAWCRLRKDIRHFRIDRIQELKVSGERFAPREDFSLKKHLKQSDSGYEKIDVRLWFHKRALERAKKESYAEFTDAITARDGCEIRTQAFSLDWTAKWILSFGLDAEALDPPALRHEVRTLAEDLAKRHKD
jgi:predicted DNA-binding transcriptional regulator YafY